MVIREVVLVVLIFLGRVDFRKDRLPDACHDRLAVNRCVADVDGDVLLLVRQKRVGVSISGNVVLGYQTLQRHCDFTAEVDLVRSDVVHHQNGDVVDVCLDVVNVAQ